MTRLVAHTHPDAALHCSRCRQYKPAREFVRGGPNSAEPNRAERYRAYCKTCHRSRNGGAAVLNTGKHSGKREGLLRDEEVEAALGVLRDYRAQRAGRQGYVYLIAAKNDDWAVKVGYSTNPEARVGEHQTGNGRLLELLAYKPGTQADEHKLHMKYIRDNTVCEWFRPSADLFTEFGLDYHEWMRSLQGAVEAPEGIIAA